VQYKEIAAKNLALHKLEFLEHQESIKEILLSLQKQITSYLNKLDLGWGNKEKETQLDRVIEGNGLKTGALRGEKGDGPGLA
jgi:2-C-methyl-D-erythritol 4-phosphate cytidylyltransferase